MRLRRSFFPILSLLSVGWLLALGGLASSQAAEELAAVPPKPKVLADVMLPASLSLGTQKLTLTGCGVRPFLWLDLYVAALYLPGASAPALGSSGQPKAIRLTVLDGSMLPLRIPPRYKTALKDYLPEAALDELDRRFASLGRGDTVWLAYRPAEGLELRINDISVARLPGHDAVAALLAAWGGEKPWDLKLNEVLGRYPC